MSSQYLLHGVFVTLQIQLAVFHISLKDAFPLQISGNPVTDGMHQLSFWCGDFGEVTIDLCVAAEQRLDVFD
ncbi:MAG: hypothetical protein AB2708_08935 [Candidatus Thiodiazotropha taylori]